MKRFERPNFNLIFIQTDYKRNVSKTQPLESGACQSIGCRRAVIKTEQLIEAG